MQTYSVSLSSEASKSFRATLAAQSLDIDVSKKLKHELSVRADLSGEWSVGLVLGSSGSGKTTLLNQAFPGWDHGDPIDTDAALIDLFPAGMSYDDCAKHLNGIGLSSVPCWIKPLRTLSNGQKFRAESILRMVASSSDVTVIDEWTSVVDRTVAKAMSHCVQKMARQMKKQIVLSSCHFDVVEWLDPDWIIDCNAQSFLDRRSLPSEERKKKANYVSNYGGRTQAPGGSLASIII